MAKIETTMTFGEETDIDTLCGVLQSLHGWSVTVTTSSGKEISGAILRDGESMDRVTLVPEHDLTLPNERVSLDEITSVVIL